MARVFYVHWNKEEGTETVRLLREVGHTVIFHYNTESGAGAEAWRSIRASPPDAIVVSLSRLPSHGRRIAAVTTQYKALRNVPVVFVGGEKEKVAVAKKEFPQGTFCTPTALPKSLESVLARSRAGSD